MNRSKAIKSISLKWKSLVWMKILLADLLTVLTTWFAFADDIPRFFYIVFGFTALVFFYLLFRSAFPSQKDLIALINDQLPEIEYSTSLAYQTNLTGIAALQQQRINNLLRGRINGISYPVSFRELTGILVFGLTMIAASRLSKVQPGKTSFEDAQASLTSIVRNSVNDYAYSSSVLIKPPAYTGLRSRRQSSPDLEKILYGSEISWSFAFTPAPEIIWISFSNGDSLPVINSRAEKKVFESGFYTLKFLDRDKSVIISEYFKLEILSDEPPEISIEGIPQYQSFYPGQQADISFKSVIEDDYGLSEASVIATITKGSGESVKFREQKLPFSKAVKGKNFQESMRFTAKQFDMEPGDELYFYVEARDNQVPPKVSKTETYFFILEDTSQMEFSLEGALGVDLMPEYFRSQRQIIIDSEKLLSEKISITKEEFDQRSNELGFDQKSLRLKYGQFIGEEADSGSDIENEIEDESEAEKPGQVDVLSEYGHDHDHENEEGQLLDKGTKSSEDVVEEMSHSHDDAEQATFFAKSMKTKLKAALNEMWDAELYLRLFKPAESLPYQYKALGLLKEIRDHARIYVHRMGFDPPPVNEKESRLKGELDEVKGETFYTDQDTENPFPDIQKAIYQISIVEKKRFPTENELQNTLESAGNEIARLAIEKPGKYLSLLSDIRKIADMETFQTSTELTALKLNLLTVLDYPDKKPVLKRYSNHALVEDFVRELTRSDR